MNVLYDGDFTVAQLAGPPEYEIPFKADPKPYAYKLPYWQFLANYTELALGSAGPLGGTYVGGSAGSFKAIGAGIIEFTREYALVPDTRNEYESFNYAYQFWQCSGSCSIAEVPKSVHSRVQYDYFRTDTPTLSIGLPRMPRVIDLFGAIYQQNGFGSEVVGTEILAEDSTFKLWKGNIYERIQRFVVVQSAGESLS